MCCGRRREEAHRAGPDREHAAGQWESWSGPAVPLGDVTGKWRAGDGRGWGMAAGRNVPLCSRAAKPPGHKCS